LLIPGLSVRQHSILAVHCCMALHCPTAGKVAASAACVQAYRSKYVILLFMFLHSVQGCGALLALGRDYL
jgi:hypothetical protein